MGAGLEVGWCKDPDRGLPAPDKILFLDISVEDAMKVQQYARFIFLLYSVPRERNACVVPGYNMSRMEYDSSD